jgi:ethanolaminephosphotransferase
MDNYLFGHYITEDGLKNIKNHKYKAGGYSILDNLMNPWWEFVVGCVPKTVAPNTLTLIGLLVNLFFYFCMFYYDPSMTKALPEWTYAGFAVGLIVYQTLDAIDGKQARRTGSSSPLGQLFDHGCDALSSSLLAIALIHTLKLGITFKAKIIIGTIWAPFYLSQLLEHHVGIVRTHVGNIGVTEGQLAQSGVMLACTILGPNIYDIPISDALAVVGYGDLIPIEYQLKDIVIFVLAINGIMYSLLLSYEMFSSIETASGKMS